MPDDNYDPVIPVDLGINAFTVHRFISVLKSRSEREKALAEWGGSADSRKYYEEEHDLPAGSFETVFLFSDPEFQAAADKINKDFAAAESKTEAVKKACEDSSKLIAQFNLKYPRAVRFLMEYQTLIMESQTRAVAYGDDPNPDIVYPLSNVNSVVTISIVAIGVVFVVALLGVLAFIVAAAAVPVAVPAAGIDDDDETDIA